MTIRVAIVTVSDGVAKGEREDRGGPACEEALRVSGIAHEIVSREVLPDDRHQVARIVRVVADGLQADLIVFTGGTNMVLESQYGWLEARLTASFPAKSGVRFR